MRYMAHEERPLHPVTGRPADYYWRILDRQGNEKRLPRWKRDLASKMGVPVEDRWFSTTEAAALVGRCTSTVLKWVQSGLLPAGRGPTEGGAGTHWFIRGKDLIAFTKGRKPLAVNASTAGAR